MLEIYKIRLEYQYQYICTFITYLYCSIVKPVNMQIKTIQRTIKKVDLHICKLELKLTEHVYPIPTFVL